jgi:hypothetical protein
VLDKDVVAPQAISIPTQVICLLNTPLTGMQVICPPNPPTTNHAPFLPLNP